MASPNWAALVPDMLHRISQLLLPRSFDYVSFRSTCTGWRSAAPRVKFSPFLLFPFDSEAGRVIMYNPSDEQVSAFSFPEARSTVFCGCSHGWFLLMDKAAKMSLVNPLTRAQIELPPADEQVALASLKQVSKVGNRWFSRSEDGALALLGLSDMREVFIREGVLSSAPDSGDGFITMAILALSTQIAYRRPSDDKWTLVDTSLSCNVTSVTYDDGRFFVMDCVGEIAVLGADRRGRIIPIALFEPPPECFNCKLVESEGDLLLVALVINCVDNENLYLDREFEVYKFNPGGEPMWIKLQSIGNRTLFLSLHYSANVAGGEVFRCKRNSIYFSGPNFVADQLVEAVMHHMEVVDLADGNSELVSCYFLPPGSESISWFQPNLYLPQV